MKRLTAFLALLTITCLPRPQFLPDEDKFTVRVYTTETTPIHDGAFYTINALIEARNPTGQNLILYAGCEFFEDDRLFATTITKTQIKAGEIKVFKLKTPLVGPLIRRSSIKIYCRYETKRINASPRK